MPKTKTIIKFIGGVAIGAIATVGLVLATGSTLEWLDTRSAKNKTHSTKSKLRALRAG